EHLSEDVAQVDVLELGPATGPEPSAGLVEWAASVEAAGAAAEAAENLPAVRVDLAGVELLALLLVAEQVEGGGDALELLLRRLVPGIGVGVMLLGELAERAAQLIRAGGARDAEFQVGVLRQAGLQEAR